MPEISRFLGIIIKMFFYDHAPPHLHAEYQKSCAVFSLKTGLMIEGDFPTKQAAFVTAWILLHQNELLSNWDALISGMEPQKIDPLR